MLFLLKTVAKKVSFSLVGALALSLMKLFGPERIRLIESYDITHIKIQSN